MTKENFNLKETYLSLPIYEAQAFKALVIQKCYWNSTIWFNKIHSKTLVSKLEEDIIVSIHNKIKNIVNDDNN